MKILVTGGGTGGHIYPAVAIAKTAKEINKNIEVLYVGTKRGFESTIVPKEKIEFKTIDVQGFRRNGLRDTIKTVTMLFRALYQSRKILNEYKPDIVIGTGGYVSGPIVFMAALYGKKTAIHEQNAFPGLTNKILSKFVTRVYLTYPNSKKYFNTKKEKLVHTGNPVRKEFMEKGKEPSTYQKGKLRVLSFGGSGGAKVINDTMMEVMEEFNGKENVEITHITGNSYYEKFKKAMENRDLTFEKNINIKQYSFDILDLMKNSDLIISRAGATTIAELSALKVPSVLIPSPNVANNHQEYNAIEFEKLGVSKMVLEKDFSAIQILSMINKMLEDDKEYIKLKNSFDKIKQIDSGMEIVNDLLGIK
jgi:UDP-N-acetylglucosamine--N-acetylmuramyl-(pentapeptide) pyrophosphoryl-undecaprenol N-acetylglucosamine transferase